MKLNTTPPRCFSMTQLPAMIVATHGRHHMAHAMVNQVPTRLQCVRRGKKGDVAVGDHVQLTLTSPTSAVIESIAPRTSLLFRSDQTKLRLLAANITQIIIVVAPLPPFSDNVLSRALVAAASIEVPIHIILNKTDLQEKLPQTQERLSLYRQLHYPVHEVSARTNPAHLQAVLLPLFEHHTTIVIGQSGMGKSTLINVIVPEAAIKTQEISIALNSGKHTTTVTRLYALKTAGYVIDSPGFQVFGLHHLTEEQLKQAFPEFSPFLGQCRFVNCHHRIEAGCAILAGVTQGKISPTRHALYQQLLQQSVSSTFS